jgi:hypothetical protein
MNGGDDGTRTRGLCRDRGIEAREHLVKLAKENLRECGVPEGAVHFLPGDVFVELDRIEPGTIETVFCFGFLHHTVHHMLLLNKIARLKPKHLILDARVSLDPRSIVEIRRESVKDDSSGAVSEAGNSSYIVIGVASSQVVVLQICSIPEIKKSKMKKFCESPAAAMGYYLAYPTPLIKGGPRPWRSQKGMAIPLRVAPQITPQSDRQL